MKMLIALGMVALAGTAHSQCQTSIVSFTGTISEGFETQVSGQFTTCINPSVFGGAADLCTPNGAAAHITGGWGFSCTIQEHGGTKLYGSGSGTNNGGAEYDFGTTAVSRFGGYFGMNHPGAPGFTATFMDSAGNVVATDVLTDANDCQWRWHGWDFSGCTTPISRINFKSNYTNTGYLMMDDMEVDLGTTCNPVIYCTPKPSSSGCTPTIQTNGPGGVNAGCPVTGACNYTVDAIQVEGGNKPGIIFYGYVAASISFMGGTLCVTPPIKRTPPQGSGGTPGLCDGTLSWMANCPGDPPGTHVFYQGWFRDPQDPTGFGVGLTDAVELVFQ